MKQRPYIIALTGSIGMGKSTTAQIFADEGIPVWDADAAVARLYSEGGAAVGPMREAFPEAIAGDAVSRDALRALIAEDPAHLERIEAIVHPLVAADRERFLEDARSDIVLLDIPLLFETGAMPRADMILVVSAPAEVQRARVLSRPDMNEELFEMILSRQLPDSEKRARADRVIITSSPGQVRDEVRDLIREIRQERNHA